MYVMHTTVFTNVIKYLIHSIFYSTENCIILPGKSLFAVWKHVIQT